MKRISIVFMETDDGDVHSGQGFQCFIEGVDTERLEKLPQDKWSAAEFWALECWRIVCGVLRKSRVVTSIQEKGKA